MHRQMGYSILFIALLVGSACARTKAQAHLDPLAGKYTEAGGGGAIYHVQALTSRFGQLHPGFIMEPENIGSSASITLVATGGIDLGSISRDLTEDEKAKVSSLLLAAVGTAVVVNAENPVSDLTSEQVRKLFSGEITDWAEVGGNPGRVKVLLRENGAATRLSFEDYFFTVTPTYADDALELHDIGQMREAVRSLKGSIGMATLESATLSTVGLKTVEIDGVPATLATLRNGSYPVRRSVTLIYNPDPNKVKPAIRAFLDFVKSPDGQATVESVNAQGSAAKPK